MISQTSFGWLIMPQPAPLIKKKKDDSILNADSRTRYETRLTLPTGWRELWLIIWLHDSEGVQRRDHLHPAQWNPEGKALLNSLFETPCPGEVEWQRLPAARASLRKRRAQVAMEGGRKKHRQLSSSFQLRAGGEARLCCCPTLRFKEWFKQFSLSKRDSCPTFILLPVRLWHFGASSQTFCRTSPEIEICLYKWMPLCFIARLAAWWCWFLGRKNSRCASHGEIIFHHLGGCGWGGKGKRGHSTCKVVQLRVRQNIAHGRGTYALFWSGTARGCCACSILWGAGKHT